MPVVAYRHPLDQVHNGVKMITLGDYLRNLKEKFAIVSSNVILQCNFHSICPLLAKK